MRYAIMFMLLVLALLAPPASAATGTFKVFRNGTVTVAIPAGQFLNVMCFGPSSAKVFKQVGGPATNSVTRFTLETNGTVTNGETTFGSYTNATNDKIEAGEDWVFYSVSALSAFAPVLLPTPRVCYSQFTPIAYTTAQTILATDMMTGIIQLTDTSTTTATYTLPTGTLTDAATNLQINQGFEWTIINLSASATEIVSVADGSGHTLVGSRAIWSGNAGTGGSALGNAARFFTRKTAANTFISYRIN